MSEPQNIELWPRTMLSAGMPPARHYGPALPRHPGAARS
jgi:hypothetical protein